MGTGWAAEKILQLGIGFDLQNNQVRDYRRIRVLAVLTITTRWARWARDRLTITPSTLGRRLLGFAAARGWWNGISARRYRDRLAGEDRLLAGETTRVALSQASPYLQRVATVGVSILGRIGNAAGDHS